MIDVLKFVYRGILTGMPMITYNSITKNTLNVPMVVKPWSTYLNFKLDSQQVDYLNDYIHEYSNMTIVPIKIRPNKDPEYILSVNIYNCTSPVFFNKEKEITRCEINTYVTDGQNNGTMILDYASNDLSMDPINIMKMKNDVRFNDEGTFRDLYCNSIKDEIILNMSYTQYYAHKTKIGNELIDYTDRVYYKNGIYDKIYYDASLTKGRVKTPYLHKNFEFSYKGMVFNNIYSLFFFTDEIRFIGGMWDNVFNDKHVENKTNC